MNAIDLLKAQHDEVEKLFEKYEKLGEDADSEKRKLFAAIADRLSAHTAIEEQFFYPAVKAKQTEDILRESLEEHLGAKRIIADLLEMQPSDENYDAKMKVLKEQVEHHVKEEEKDMFPKVKKIFAKEDLDALGEQMKPVFDEMVAADAREEIPSQTDEAAPL
ncbi:hemerythrin domain-containing protein [Aggregicoccus sp. 17bor-14]|uniref:hemerythrin domain-containing protein n=1 Tax=Myxococcaceae TaxID=31 RepID=UPI00129C3D7B|nr:MULTISPECIES: hemerythrin domain-containing protein [Myxococcaceae]MBF5043856.1 hemerythrin domain-containing protein [Simulacricoccus sp. 17bor-14]MRI89608.1 hemerythrin domain-containing protein [Aggregicoccus sp. 17bor-14]